jgi:hypothetical protein
MGVGIPSRMYTCVWDISGRGYILCAWEYACGIYPVQHIQHWNADDSREPPPDLESYIAFYIKANFKRNFIFQLFT